MFSAIIQRQFNRHGQRLPRPLAERTSLAPALIFPRQQTPHARLFLRVELETDLPREFPFPNLHLHLRLDAHIFHPIGFVPAAREQIDRVSVRAEPDLDLVRLARDTSRGGEVAVVFVREGGERGGGNYKPPMKSNSRRGRVSS